MALYRFTWTVTEHGFELANGERLLEGFEKAYPDLGVSVSQNTASGHLSATFSIEGDDIHAALEKATDVFATGAAKSGLEPTDVIDLNASLAEADEYEEERELQPA